MNVITPVELHNAFKAATAAQGLDMSTVVLDFVRDYVARHSPSTKQTKRRRP
jgi:hypothetical protein